MERQKMAKMHTKTLHYQSTNEIEIYLAFFAFVLLHSTFSEHRTECIAHRTTHHAHIALIAVHPI